MTGRQVNVRYMLALCRPRVSAPACYHNAGEESRGGAVDMIEAGALDGVSGISGLHVWPDSPSGVITTKANPLCLPHARLLLEASRAAAGRLHTGLALSLLPALGGGGTHAGPTLFG
jgi:hypothetical protein